MKKNSLIAAMLLATVLFMSLAIKHGKSVAAKATTYAANSLTDSSTIIKNQIPLLNIKKNDSNVFAAIYEEDEDKDIEIKLEIDNSHISPTIPASSNAKILIYHTHINEAYSQTDTYKYSESGAYRTNDRDKSVARVGKELSQILQQEYGITTVHDTNDFEPPKLGTAYNRSLKMLEQRIANKENYDIYIDIHRDAYPHSPSDTIMIDGKPTAKIMVVIGTGEGNNGTPILPQPEYKANYAYAQQITDNINKQVKGLAKSVRVNKSRYNQHISKKAILIEMGYTGNNLDEVLRSVPYLAKAIDSTIQK